MGWMKLALVCVLWAAPSVAADWYTATNDWTLEVGGSMDSTPAIGPDGSIYACTFKGRLFAISPDGRIQWTFKAAREIRSSPALGADGTLYFGSRDRKVYD